MDKNIHIFVLGNNQAGGAQHSFLREAKIIEKKTNGKIYFISAGKSKYSLTKEIKTSSFKKIEFNNLLSINPFLILRYALFVYSNIKRINSLNPESNLICSHTTPLASLICTTICIILRIKNTRYRIGGLLYSKSLPFYIRTFGFLIDWYNLKFNRYISFVCFENKNQYIRSYPFLLKKLNKIDVFYSICTEISKSKNISIKEKYKNIETYKSKDNLKQNTNLLKLIKNKKIILTVINDKSKKGSKLFYKVSKKAIDNESFLFIHVGTRKVNKIKLVSKNLLIVPHTSNNEVIEWIKLSDLTMLLSKYPEGLPQVIPQSLFCGKPVFCFENTGVSESILNGFNGCIIPNNLKDYQIFILLKNFINSKNFKNITSNTEDSMNFYKDRHSTKNFKETLLQSNFYKVLEN